MVCKHANSAKPLLPQLLHGSSGLPCHLNFTADIVSNLKWMGNELAPHSLCMQNLKFWKICNSWETEFWRTTVSEVLWNKVQHCTTHIDLCRGHFHFCSVPSTWPIAAFCRRNSSFWSSCRSMKLPESTSSHQRKMVGHNLLRLVHTTRVHGPWIHG